MKPIPIVSYVSEETVSEAYAQIKDEIAELFKNELATLDKEDETPSPKTDLKVNATKPGEKPLSKKQRRQQSKRNRQREWQNMRKIKQVEDNKASNHNEKFIWPVKNNDKEQAMSM